MCWRGGLEWPTNAIEIRFRQMWWRLRSTGSIKRRTGEDRSLGVPLPHSAAPIATL